MRYSYTDRTRLERGPLPSMPPHKRGAPWWAGWVLAIIGALGGGAGIKAILGQGEEQIRLLTAIQFRVGAAEEAAKGYDRRLSLLETYNQADHIRDELAFQAICSALEQEGYSIRGLDCKQVGYASTRNKAKPRQAVTNNGKQLQVPDAIPPPAVQ